MKNNRQVGLDGKIFVSACMHRGSFFAFILMLYGLLTAGADILKLTGASGVAMGSFTTTLLIYDFIVSLMLVAVVFYAYFLECGADVPVLKEKPLVVFGFFRLGYYLLLGYYISYHMLYCFANKDAVPRSLGIYYLLYLVLICLLVLANCYIFNTITRNIIRRSYGRSFRRLAIVGLIVQVLLPVSYLFVRIFMKDVGDEFLTSAVCDLIRLCVCPLLLSSLWFLFLHAKEQVNDVYREVDSAIVSKRYQITYSAYTSGKNGKNGEPVKASATILPAPAETPAIPQSKKEKPALPSAVSKTADAVSAAVIASNVQEAAAEKAAAEKPAEEAAAKTVVEEVKEEPAVAPSETISDEKISEFAAEARRAVAKSSQQTKSQQPKNVRPQKPTQRQTAAPQKAQQPQQTAPVQEFDPFPASSVPRNTQKKTAPAVQNRSANAQRPQQSRPQQGQRPAQTQQNRPQQGQRPAQAQQQSRPQQGQRSVQNNPNRQRGYNGQNGGPNGSSHR